MQYGVAHHGFVFGFAEDDTHRGVVVGLAFEVVEHAYVHVHLAYVLMGYFSSFEIEQHKALQQVVIKYQIDVEVAGFGTNAKLPAHEGEAFAKFDAGIVPGWLQGRFRIRFLYATPLPAGSEIPVRTGLL